MIRHTVLFNVREGLSKQTIDHAINELLALKNKLPGIHSMVGGECQFHEQKSKRAFAETFTHGFSIDFEDKSAYDAFLNDPITHPAKDGIINIAEKGYEGIVGFDMVFREAL